MADFNELTLAETAYKAGVGQDVTRKIKDNFTNLNTRLLQLESRAEVFEHFLYPSYPLIGPDVGEWDDGSSGIFSRDAYSVIKAQSGQGNQSVGHAITRGLIFDELTRPLTFETRIKWGGSGANTRMASGFGGYRATTRGVWLEMINSTQMRFSSRDSAGQFNGTAFSRIAISTWFKVKIIFTDDPSDRALCYVDDVLKETITSNLPTPDELRCMSTAWSTGAGDLIFVDWIRMSALAFDDAA